MANAQQPVLEQTEFPQQGPLPQASGADFGAQVGEATTGLGGKLSDAGDVMAKNVLAWQGLKNEASAQDLNVSFQSDLGKLETGYYGLKGKQQADAYPDFENQVLALRQQYLGKASNPMVANMLGGVLSQSIGYTLRSAGRQAGAATKDWMIQSAAGHAGMLVYQAQNHYNDPSYVATAKQGIKDSVQNYGELSGWSQDTIGLEVIKQYGLLDKGIQDSAQSTLNSLPLSDAATALIGQGAAKPGEVGGQAYKLALVRTEFGSGVDTPGNPHQGPVQANDDWLARFGGGKTRDQMTLQDWMDATDRETAVNKPLLEKALGRSVTDADLYLAHQQGEAGAEALLKNPSAPASQSVPVANIAANLPANPGLDPSTITGGQFAALWSKGFATPSGITGAPSMASQQALDAVAALSPENRQAMAKSVLAALNAQDAAVREQTNFAQAQQAKADKQQYDAVKTQAEAVMAANWANPGKDHPPLDLAQFSQTSYAKQHPELVTDLMNYAKNFSNKPGNGDAVTAQLYRGYLDGTKTTADFEEAYAPKDGSPGSISFAQMNQLMTVAKNGGDSVDAKNTNALKAKFLQTTESGMKNDALEGMTEGQAQYRFQFDFEKAWADRVAKGEDPKALITPGNKDYFGTPANLAHYQQSAADQLADEAAGPGLFSRAMTAVGSLFSPEPTQAGVSIPPDLPKGTTYAGKTKDGRDAFRLPDGSLKALNAPVATPAPAAAPVADTGPAVPTGP